MNRTGSLSLSAAAIAMAAALMAATSSQAPAAYEIELRMTGYTGLVSSPGCDAITDSTGYDVLKGTVKTIEDPDPGADQEYSGTLTRSTKIDYCLVKPAPTEDQVKECVAKLTGGALMQVHIEVYGEQGRGAWVKAEPVLGTPFAPPTVVGDCKPDEQDEIKQEYPSGESAGSPSGQPIAENPANPMFVNGHARLPPQGFFPPRRPETLWSLKVIRKVQ